MFHIGIFVWDFVMNPLDRCKHQYYSEDASKAPCVEMPVAKHGFRPHEEMNRPSIE